jgi:MFS family permease
MRLSSLLPSPPPVPPDSFRSRGGVVVLSAFLCLFLGSGFMLAMGVIFKALLLDASLGGDRTSTSWVLSIAFAMLTGSGLFAGKLIALLGPRLTVVLGACIASAGFFSSSFVTRVEVLYVTYGVAIGTGIGLSNQGTIFAVICHFVQRRAMAVGLSVAGGGVGTLVLGPVLQLIIDAQGWRGALRILAAVMIAALPVFALPFTAIAVGRSQFAEPSAKEGDGERDGEREGDGGLKGKGEAAPGDDPATTHAGSGAPTTSPSSSSSSSSKSTSLLSDDHLPPTPPLHGAPSPASASAPSPSPAPSAAPAPSQSSTGFFSLLRIRPFALALFGASLYSGCSFTLVAHVVAFAGESPPNGPGMTALAAAGLTSYSGVANTIGRVAFGRLADVKGLSRMGNMQLTLLASGLCAIGLAVDPTSPSFLTFFQVVYGLTAGSVVSTFSSIVADLVPPNSVALGLGLSNFSQAPFILAAPVLAGALRDFTGSYRAVWAVIAALMTAAALVMAPENVVGALRWAGTGDGGCSRCSRRKGKVEEGS